MTDAASKVGCDIGDLFTVSEKNEDIPESLNEVHKDTLIIFDDKQTENKKILGRISNVFCNSRNRGISCIWVGQAYYRVPKDIRDNVDYIIFKRVNSIKDRQRVISEYLDDEKEEHLFMKCYEKLLNNPDDFILIDCKTTVPHLKIRYNYLPTS